MKLANNSSNLGSGCLLLFGIAWTCFSCLFTIIPVTGSLGNLLLGDQDPTLVILSLIPTLCSLPFILLGFAIMWYGARPFIAQMRVSAPEILIAQNSFRVGDEVSFTYQQTFKSASEVKRLAYDLVLRETARYRRGTNTYTVTYEHRVDGYEYPGRNFEAGEQFNDRRTFRLPRESMHTFETPNNKLNWYLKVKVEIAGWPDFAQDYEIKVLPEIA